MFFKCKDKSQIILPKFLHSSTFMNSEKNKNKSKPNSWIQISKPKRIVLEKIFLFKNCNGKDQANL